MNNFLNCIEIVRKTNNEIFILYFFKIIYSPPNVIRGWRSIGKNDNEVVNWQKNSTKSKRK